MEMIQMKASTKLNQLERQGNHELRQMYQSELDAIISLKKNEIQSKKDVDSRDADLITKSIQKCKELEDSRHNLKRERERLMIIEAQAHEKKRKEESIKRKEKEALIEREMLRESVKLEARILQERKEKLRKEKENFQNHYNQTLNRKQEEKNEEKHRNARFYEEEQRMLEKMENDNFEFIENIRNRLSKNKDAINFYERLYANTSEKQQLEYKRTIEKPILENLQRELENEKKELLLRNQLKNENNKFLVEQIEINARMKEMLQYEQTKNEYERLVEDLEKQDYLDKETKLIKKQNLMDILNTLKSQIESKSNFNRFSNNMNMHEYRVNDVNKKYESKETKSKDIGSSIPGFVIPHERKRQLAVLEQSIKVNNHFISSAMHAQHQENSNSIPCNRKKFYQPDVQNSLLCNKENINRQSSDFASDYQFIRHRNKNSCYDIISNSVRPF
jgi:hypothetical protein